MYTHSKPITQKNFKDVKDAINYNHVTGIFTWKVDIGRRIKAGRIAGTVTRKGYRSITFKNQHYLAHRLAWFFIHGYSPENQIDHIDRDKLNNKICNLREASPSCNARNTSVSKSNSSGIKGVYWNKANNSWKAQICIDGIHIFLGYHNDIVGAAMARWEAEKKYSYPDCSATSSAYEYLIENTKCSLNL